LSRLLLEIRRFGTGILSSMLFIYKILA